jgi:hypothetical protein
MVIINCKPTARHAKFGLAVDRKKLYGEFLYVTDIFKHFDGTKLLNCLTNFMQWTSVLTENYTTKDSDVKYRWHSLMARVVVSPSL